MDPSSPISLPVNIFMFRKKKKQLSKHWQIHIDSTYVAPIPYCIKMHWGSPFEVSVSGENSSVNDVSIDSCTCTYNIHKISTYNYMDHQLSYSKKISANPRIKW